MIQEQLELLLLITTSIPSTGAVDSLGWYKIVDEIMELVRKEKLWLDIQMDLMDGLSATSTQVDEFSLKSVDLEALQAQPAQAGRIYGPRARAEPTSRERAASFFTSPCWNEWKT